MPGAAVEAGGLPRVYQAWVLTRLPALLLALRFCDSACRKLFKVLPLSPDSPSALSRFWKLCCKSATLLVVVLLLAVESELDELVPDVLLADNLLIRFCRSDCNCAGPPEGGGGQLPEVAETPAVEEVLLELLPLPALADVPLESLCACRFSSRFCRRAPSAWPTSPVLELLPVDDPSELEPVSPELVLVLVLEPDPVTPICDSACTIASTMPPPDGGAGGVLPSTLRLSCLVLPTWVNCAMEKLLDMLLIVMMISFGMETVLMSSPRRCRGNLKFRPPKKRGEADG